MTIRNGTQIVEVGDCIFIPSKEPHGLVNGGNAKLIYFSCRSVIHKRRINKSLAASK